MEIKNFKFKIINSGDGFTLIEAVVATALFAFVMSSIIGVYISTLQLDRKTRAERAVVQNGQYIMDFLAKEVRNGSINYASYTNPIPANPDLYVENQANELEHFSSSNQNMVMTKNGQFTNLNSSDVQVTKLNFLISPTSDPYTPAKLANEQPHVTVVLELTAASGANQVKINLEGTYSTRYYPSRQ